MSSSTSHISFERLVDMAEARVKADEAAVIAAHLSICQACSEADRRLRGLLELMRSDSAENAPDYALARAINMLPGHEPRLGVVRRILATLKLDTAGMTPAYGFRSETAGERQLLFEAGETRLHLQVSPAGEQFVITGQLLGPPGTGQVELKSEAGSLQAVLDEQSEFVLPAVAGGSYWMVLRLSDLELEVPEFKLGV
ncbi:MAG TPA: hypothetical protein VKJ45_18325 [Blastocatellia bacterium]|nr:hypothetical protein [Blastocatellia bacterium]